VRVTRVDSYVLGFFLGRAEIFNGGKYPAAFEPVMIVLAPTDSLSVCLSGVSWLHCVIAAVCLCVCQFVTSGPT